MKDGFLRLLESHFSKLILGAFGFGLVFGLGFLAGAGKRRSPLQMVQPGALFGQLAEKEKNYAQVQEQVKLTYYTELLQHPKTEPVQSAEPVEQTEEPVLKSNPFTENTPSSKRMAEALAHVLGRDTPSSVQDVIKQSLPTSTGSPYVIQIASFPSREAAQSMLQRIRSKGHDVRLVQADIAGKGVVYRLRIHGFKTREEAEAYKQKNHLEGIILSQ